MYKFEKVKKILSEPNIRFNFLCSRGFYNNLSDEEFIKREWKSFYGYDLDLSNPLTLTEKIQWLKLNYRKPEFTRMVDKFEAREFVKARVGDKHIIPLLGVWDNVDNIDFNKLPNEFVLKPTQDSGGLIICRDKSKLDITITKEKLKKAFSRDYFLQHREWAYKNVKHRIIAEPLIKELGNPDSIEYKTTCFNGKVAFVTICKGIAHSSYDDRSNDHFDKNFQKLDWYVNYKPAQITPEKPKEWDELISFCEALASDIPYLRVDTYIIDGIIIFGEMTFYTWAGLMHFKPSEWDRKLGDMLVLPEAYCCER